MDPAEEVLLDPVPVNPVFFTARKESYSCANRTVQASSGAPAGAGERNAHERDDSGSKALTRRMREFYK
jgi:hypothetical protein